MLGFKCFWLPFYFVPVTSDATTQPRVEQVSERIAKHTYTVNHQT